MTQQQALSILKTGANVFLTGEPGSGKTHVVNTYVKYLRSHNIEVAVTASTGIAATHIGGMTIHSWSGVGIKQNLSEHDLAVLQLKPHLVKRAQKTTVLIIDEISMVDAQLISDVDQVLQTLRDSAQPFGGIQIVFVGDFFQLPPVQNQDQQVQFAFHAPSWKNAKPVVCYLTEQHRQSDTKLTSILKSIRSGIASDQPYQELLERQVEIDPESTHTRLYSHNINVDQLNSFKLKELDSQQYTFDMVARGKRIFVDQLKKGCLSPETLILKKGAQVMFTKNNYEEGYVNGTLGEVVDIVEQMPIVQTPSGEFIEVTPVEWSIVENNKTLASIKQLPLRLAWAITVHKSQGMTLDAAIMDLSETFEYGQGYVAISRVKSWYGLFLAGINHKALEVHPEIKKMDDIFQQQSKQASAFLNTYSQNQLDEKHTAFILHCDGTTQTVETTKKKAKVTASTYDETLILFQQGKSLNQIAQLRNLKVETVVSHFEKLKKSEKLGINELQQIVPSKIVENLPAITRAFSNTNDKKLSPVFHDLNGQYTYEELKLARLLI